MCPPPPLETSVRFKDVGPTVRSFLNGRGVFDSDIETFSIKQYTPENTGLDPYSCKYGNTYAVFPLTDILNNVVGYQFRSVSSKSYVTHILKKDAPECFGYAPSFPRIVKTKTVFLVEGVFDLFPLFRFGVPVISALTAGISVSLERSLKRWVNVLFLSFDRDSAGKRATQTILERNSFPSVKDVSFEPSFHPSVKDVGDLWVKGGDSLVSEYLRTHLRKI